MQVKRFVRSMIAVASGLLSTVAAAAAVQHQHTQPADSRPPAQASAPQKAEQTLKVGKTDDVDFSVQTVVGERKFKPGRYQIQHRVEGDAHFVHFTEVSKGLPSGAGAGEPIAHAGEVQCRVELLDKKASKTTVYAVQEGEAKRVTKVLIAGENVAHIF